MTEVIVIRVPKKLKEMMKRVPVDWPKFLRRVIRERIKRELMKNAARELDRIRRRVKELPPGTIETWIREDRESR